MRRLCRERLVLTIAGSLLLAAFITAIAYLVGTTPPHVSGHIIVLQDKSPL